MEDSRTKQLRNGVLRAYTAAAEYPLGEHPFPVGRVFAESVGYPKEMLNTLPSMCSEAFAGVSNVAIFAEIPEAATVLDVGCGAGLDILIASQRIGNKGKAIGIDFSEAMLVRARQAADEAGAMNVEFRPADAEGLPIEDHYADVVLVNGIFNLNPSRRVVFEELSRVVKPGGRVYAAELILKEPLPEEIQASMENWFA